MFCAVVSAVAILFAGDYIFFKFGKFNDVYKSVKVFVPDIFQYMNDYGMAAWGALLIATVVSFDRAIRNPLGHWTLTLNVSVAIATVGFSFLTFHAAWAPFYSLLQGIGTER
ncbi:MAG TPA: hypothetical protein VJU16_00940 [Planctomycetota bacterium]|nr:hypothetical protein [Planctomycetota bacterium]